LPNNVGRTASWKSITGQLRHFTIEDEIRRLQSDHRRNKVICLQKIRRHQDGHFQYRLGDYMLGVKSGMRGRWVWGQYATMRPAVDFRYLVREARKRGWF